jgi:hypothetical protein
MFCFLLIGRKKKKRKKERQKHQGAFSPGQDMPCWLCPAESSQLLGGIKS